MATAPYSDEFSQFVTVEQPDIPEPEAPAAPASPTFSQEQLDQILTRNRQDIRQEVSNLASQLPAPAAQPQAPSDPYEGMPEHFPVSLDADNKPVISRKDLMPIIDQVANKRVEKYHNENVQPYAQTVEQVRHSAAVQDAAKAVRSELPDIFEGRDANHIGQMAIDMFNSSGNTGRDPNEKADWAIARLKELYPVQQAGEGAQTTGSQPAPPPYSTGNQMRQQAGANNQVGNTAQRQAGAADPMFNYPKGATIQLKSASMQDVGGVDEMARFAQFEETLRQYNQHNGMGWKFKYVD